LTITAVIAFISLVLAGIGWLGAVREGVRAVFGAEMALGHLVSTKLRDFGVLCALGVGVLFSAALTTMAGGTAGWIAERIGLSGQSWLLVLAGVPVSVLTDTALMLLLMGVVSGVHASWRDLLHGALLGGVGFSLLKLCADALLLRLTANPLFASIAVVIGLLIWLNLIARLTLLSAAWAANDVDERHAEERSPAEQADPSVAVPRNASSVAGTAAGAPRTAAARRPVLPTFGPRSADRATLAAGAVLGAAAVAATGTMFRAIRSLVGLGRR
jgi:membrane protein